MRVLIVSHTYITPINRKKWQVFASLYPDIYLTVLFPSHWPCALFNHQAESDLSSFESKNCRFISFGIFKSGNEILYGYKTSHLFSLIKSIKPDLIHVEQGDNAFSYFQCILFAKMLRLNPKFVFFTWVNWQQKFSLKYKLFWKFIERFNLKNSHGAFVGNADASVILKNKKFNKDICVLPQLGVDIDTFKPAEKLATIKYIGFVGRLVQEKGVFLLFDVFAKLSKKYPDWELVYLGNGPCKSELACQIKLKQLEHLVKIQNTVSHDDVVHFIQKLDILALPSFDTVNWREQFGHVLIEAMACAIPVVGSDAGEIPNVIADAGIVFAQKNPDSLQYVLEKLMRHGDLRKKIGLLGYQKAKNLYSHEAIANKTYEFWDLIMK